MHDWTKLLVTLRHVNIWDNILHKILILEIGYATRLILQIQYFFIPYKKYILQIFFQS